ncbi:MAG: hypothetical protein R3D25_05820 [Geminicoccaceae bacterium]
MRQGRFAGRELAALSQGELLDLLAEAGTERPAEHQPARSYLDRRFPDWREAEREGPAAAGSAGMDEQEALEILGLQKVPGRTRSRRRIGA